MDCLWLRGERERERQSEEVKDEKENARETARTRFLRTSRFFFLECVSSPIMVELEIEKLHSLMGSSFFFLPLGIYLVFTFKRYLLNHNKGDSV